MPDVPAPGAAPMAPRQARAQDVPPPPPGFVPVEQADAEPFNADAWNKARADRITSSKAAGNKHLDDIEPAVETMRGLEIYNAHDPREIGKVRTVANTGDVVIHWADEYSAEKNLAETKTERKKAVWESWLAPSDLKDYVVGKPSASAAPEVSTNVDSPAPEVSPIGDISESSPRKDPPFPGEAAKPDVSPSGDISTDLAEAFRDAMLDGGGFSSILGARKFAAERGLAAKAGVLCRSVRSVKSVILHYLPTRAPAGFANLRKWLEGGI